MARFLRYLTGASALCLVIFQATAGLGFVPTAPVRYDNALAPSDQMNRSVFCPLPLFPMLPEGSIHLRGLLRGGRVDLLWDMTNEVDIASYTVERSTDGATFTEVGTLRSSGNHARYTYRFQDRYPVLASPTNYYRILVCAGNGGRFYSATKTLRQAAISGRELRLRKVGAGACSTSPQRQPHNTGPRPSIRFI